MKVILKPLFHFMQLNTDTKMSHKISEIILTIGKPLKFLGFMFKKIAQYSYVFVQVM